MKGQPRGRPFLLPMLSLARRHDRRGSESLIVGIGMMVDVRLAQHNLSFKECQPGDAVAEAAECVVVLGAVPECANRKIRAGRQHLRWRINGGRVELNRLEGAAVGKVLSKRTRIRAGVEWQLSDQLLCDHQNGAAVNAPSSVGVLWLSLVEAAELAMGGPGTRRRRTEPRGDRGAPGVPVSHSALRLRPDPAARGDRRSAGR